MVPQCTGKTQEDPTIHDPEERLRLYGKKDHVRLYGEVFIDRLITGRFHVTPYTALDFLTKENIAKMAIKPKTKLYYCKKAAN